MPRFLLPNEAIAYHMSQRPIKGRLRREEFP